MNVCAHVCVCVCVCRRCCRSGWQLQLWEEAGTRRDAAALVSLPIQPRLTGSCLTHGLGLMHMKESTMRKNRNNNYLFLYVCVCVFVCVCVCVFMRMFFWINIRVNHSIGPFHCFTGLCLCACRGIHLSSCPLSSPQLIPQFFFMTLGITGATLYLIRLGRGPHVT